MSAMPKAFLVKKQKGKDELEEPVLDQQVPSGNPFYYHPALYYPPEYYGYLPTLWARHYQEIATSWQNFSEKPSFNNGAIPGLNLPQPLNLPQLPTQAFTQSPFNPQSNQHQASVPNLFQSQTSATQSDQQFQQQFQQLIDQHHQNAQLQQQYGAHNQQKQYDNDPNDKVKRDLYNEFFDLDSNAAKKDENMLLPNAVAAALENRRAPKIKSEPRDDGSETDSVTSSDSSKCSESSSAAVVDNIINSGLDPTMVKRDSKIPSKNIDGELSPKSGEEGDKVYLCEFCNKKFTRSWNYQRHILIHSGRKPHKCEVCQKAFVLAAHLKIHMRIHTGEKPYKCTVCGRGFAQLTNLQRHVLTHTGQKPHRCQHCNKGFVSSSDLRRHIRIHTGEKPYQCHACSKAFTTSGNLQSHVLTHTGVKPYSCSICKWKFISSSNLRTHIRTHHCSDDGSELQMVPDNGAGTPVSNEEQVFLPTAVKTN